MTRKIPHSFPSFSLFSPLFRLFALFNSKGNEENGFAAKFAKLKYAVVVPTDHFPEIPDPRTYLGQQLGVLGAQAGALLSVVPAQQQQFLRQCCQQAGVNL